MLPTLNYIITSISISLFSEECTGDPAECLMQQLQAQGLVGSGGSGADKQPNPNEGRNFLVKNVNGKDIVRSRCFFLGTIHK